MPRPKTKQAKLKEICQDLESRDNAFKTVSAKMTEHFDAAFIIGSWTENGQTFMMSTAVGNKYAVHGMLEEAMLTLEPEPEEMEEF